MTVRITVPAMVTGNPIPEKISEMNIIPYETAVITAQKNRENNTIDRACLRLPLIISLLSFFIILLFIISPVKIFDGYLYEYSQRMLQKASAEVIIYLLI